MAQLTPFHQFPYLLASQSDKHVTMNEALDRIDSIVQIAVLTAGVATQPLAPSQGDRYILAAAPTGEQWQGFAANVIATFLDGAWQAIVPKRGCICFVADDDLMLMWSGTTWVSLAKMFSVSRSKVLLGRRSNSSGVIEVINISPIALGLVDALTAKDARLVLGCVGRAGSESIAGQKTFSSPPIFTNGLELNRSAESGSKLFDVNNVTAVLNCTGGILTINSQDGSTTLLQISRSGAYTSSGTDSTNSLGIAFLRWSGV